MFLSNFTLESVKEESEYSSLQKAINQAPQIESKDSRHPTVLISNPFKKRKLEPEFVDTNEVTYKMLLSSKYWRTFLVGVSVASFQQLTGLNAISAYTYTITVPGLNVYGFRFIVYLLRFVFSLITLYIVNFYGRKSLILAGFLTACFCNCILFQLSDDRNDNNDAFETYLTTLTITIIVFFYLSYVMTVGTTAWIYMAETLPRRALGIALCCYYILSGLIIYLPDFLVRIVKVIDNYNELYQSIVVLFLFFSGSCI